VTDGLLNALDFGLLFSKMFVRQTIVERSFQSLELSIPIKQTPTREPIVSHWQKAEQREAKCYGCH